MASFPSSIKTFPTLVDLADSVLAAHQNDRGDEITAVETELGADPAGSDTNVVTRLDRMEAEYAMILDTVIIEGLRLSWNSATSIDVGVGRCFAENGDFIDVTSAITKGSLSLSSSTWYHVYVYLDSGTPAAEVVTTAPVAWRGSAYSKTSDTSRRYVGSLRTDGSGNVYEFQHDLFSSAIFYRNQALNASPFRVLSSGTATTATSVDLSAVVPVTSLIARLRVVNTSDKSMFTGYNSSVSSSIFQCALVAGNTVQTTLLLDHLISSSQTVHYLMSGTVGAGDGAIDVYGYLFKR